MKRNLRIFIYSSLFVHLAGGTALFLYYFSPSAPRSVHRSVHQKTTNDRTKPLPQKTAGTVLKTPEESFKTEGHSPDIPTNNAPQTEDLITIDPSRENFKVSDTSKPPSVKPAENLPLKNKPATLSSGPKEPEKKIPGKMTQGQHNPALTGTASPQATGQKTAQTPLKSTKTSQLAQTTDKPLPPPLNNEKSTQKSTTLKKPIKPIQTAQTPLKSTKNSQLTQTTDKPLPPPLNNEKSTQKSTTLKKPIKPIQTAQTPLKSTKNSQLTQTTDKPLPQTLHNEKSTQKSTTLKKPIKPIQTAQTPLKSTKNSQLTQTTDKPLPQTLHNEKSTQKSTTLKKPIKPIQTAQTPLKTSPAPNSPVENPPDLSSANFRDFQDLKQKRGNPKLIYPQEARKKKIQGTVSIIYFVSPEGLVDKIQLTKSSGSSLLDNQTLRTVARYEFFPGQAGWVQHTVAFVLNGEEEQILKLRRPTE